MNTTGLQTRSSSPAHGTGRRGFTLVELMVAVTGGLFISIIVFAMARQGTRFYQQESRIAEATLAATIGMQRLRADIGRAGYMASPNINTDPNLCTPVAALNGVPLLANMRSLQIDPEPNAAIINNPDLRTGAAAAIVPDTIQLAGAYQNADRFIVGQMPPAPAGGAGIISIPLQPNLGALFRYGYMPSANQAGLLNSLFPAGRALRLVNQYGKIAYGIIANTTPNGGPSNNLPAINLAAAPAIPLGGAAGNVCNFVGVGVEVNVVNFFRYRIADIQHDATVNGFFGQMYASTDNPWDSNRTELVREEMNPVTALPFTQANVNGNQVPLAPEIVAEYAVDLKFEVTATDVLGTQLITTPGPTGTVYAIAGSVVACPACRPQRVRSVRVRLSVRSREADRAGNVPSAGLYRLGITSPSGARAFARVRTLQADVAVPNHFGVP